MRGLKRHHRHVGSWRHLSLIGWIVLLACMWGAPVRSAQPETAPAPQHAAADEKVQHFLDLLADPEIRRFLARQSPTAETPAPEPAAASTMSASLGERLQGLRAHVFALGEATGDVPDQVRMAQTMAVSALQQRGLTITVLGLAAFVLLGFCGQWLFQWIGRPFRDWLFALNLDTVEHRLQAVTARLLFGLGLIVSYAAFSIGAFLLFDWPSLIKAVLLGFLIAFLIVRLSAVVSRFMLAPGAVRFRVVPVSTRTAWFLHIRVLLAAIVTSFGWQIIVLLGRFGFSAPAQELSTDAIGLLLLGLALETLWRLPPLGGMDDDARERRPLQSAIALLLTVLLIVLWAFWAAGATFAASLLAFLIAQPLVVLVSRSSVVHLLRPAGTMESPTEAHVSAVLFERGVRALLITGAALLLARICDVDLVSLTMRDTFGTQVLRGLISVVVIALAADFLWTAIRALVESKLKRPLPLGSTEADLGHAARLQTLLPIVSNILLATIVIVAAMMMLAALGVQIGPLIASAGVVGVAIGFGAQTLVKDVISGIFYLVDDAFRIGEYIQSGTYKGTVESFSLRSVKLRHQRGALYTVPFGILGAVQNQSRDWVVDKIVMNVPFDTDLDKVRKLIKRIGEDLAADPEFGSEILSPLKMQGVSQFGDFAIQIQTKMMTKPGDVQFAARRRALLLIKLAFSANGIGFALPTVQVSGDSSMGAAAALGLSTMNAAKAAE